MVYKGKAQAKTFPVQSGIGRGFYSRVHLHVGHDMVFNGGLGKSLCIFHKNWRLLIKGLLLASWVEGRGICFLFFFSCFSDLLWFQRKKCGRTFYACYGNGNEMVAWQATANL
ncbi:hypothetical protein EYC80_005739 [Monilinia laxa]|uniref:Uncharacterized protein n=1 Tax=Monilinia laxa TaxID=61186 RepID=A0A5N6KEX2_MONLA|nr:hypothetical protein EYC80_005739 [Monilinia laxa]